MVVWITGPDRSLNEEVVRKLKELGQTSFVVIYISENNSETSRLAGERIPKPAAWCIYRPADNNRQTIKWKGGFDGDGKVTVYNIMTPSPTYPKGGREVFEYYWRITQSYLDKYAKPRQYQVMSQSADEIADDIYQAHMGLEPSIVAA